MRTARPTIRLNARDYIFFACVVGAFVILISPFLTGCTSAGGVPKSAKDVDPVQSVRIACALLPAAHQTFLQLVKDPDKIAIEAKVKAGIDAVCAHPEAVTDVAGAIGIVSDGVARIMALQK